MSFPTPVEGIQSSVESLYSDFHSSPFPSIDYTYKQLKSLRKSLVKYKSQLYSALQADFHRSPLETGICDYGQALGELDYFLANLKSLRNQGNPVWYPLTHVLSSIQIEKIPLGLVLIISPFNYPLNLSLIPLVGVLAGGNKAVVKLPYDQIPKFCEVYTKILYEALSTKDIFVVNGGIAESEKLLELKYDKIVFTGSVRVGKIINEIAAKNLTPVLLELGGKCPCIITENYNSSRIKEIVNRVIWGSFINSGQTCVCVDYLMIHESVYDEFIDCLVLELSKLKFDSETEFTHIVNSSSYDRLMNLIKLTHGEVIFTGDHDKETNFIHPTIIKDVQLDDELMKGEIFGPLLPILKYKDLQKDVIQEINTNENLVTPLALYVFTDSHSEIETIKSRIQTGSIGWNETIMQIGSSILPFGGIGNSGNASTYHGKYSIDQFTFSRPLLKEPFWCEFMLKDRYFPYNGTKLNKLMIFYESPLAGVYKLNVLFQKFIMFIVNWFVNLFK